MSPGQCRAARALIALDQDKLASAAGIARATVIDFEKEQRIPRAATVAAIRAALEAFGIEFIPENGGGAGVRLKVKRNDF